MLVRTAEGKRDIRALWMEKGVVKAIDQRLLPSQLKIVTIRTVAEMAHAISDMTIRGAPSIGAAGAYGMALAWLRKENLTKASITLVKTRPTAHDLSYGVNLMLSKCDEDLVEVAESFADDIVEMCRKIGENGAKLIKDGYRILTHCNAGALATVDFGTALAPMRVAHRQGKSIFVYVDETRPRLQGAKLTAWELGNEGIDHAIISDNAAGHFMKSSVDLVIVGADRIARNGDFANKIGTYSIAVLAKENWVPFYVAAPMSTFDPKMRTGKEIMIEERSEDEVLQVGGCRIGPKGSRALNPAFDVTPARYVKGFITEKGILRPGEFAGLRGR
ncbi:MAG: S-methyl-5-thioribose-1-phosphate isomerase [Thermoplasmatota archaeon]|nr:S-methyl-5-thioribose-1-phosphate isomerase [Candidatus Thermoplasmatota archaeon]MBU1913704.1 S-methyl-5-thioribose-1-phosphate isomerase [Candidatus Thermoplasmatota archaeon]